MKSNGQESTAEQDRTRYLHQRIASLEQTNQALRCANAELQQQFVQLAHRDRCQQVQNLFDELPVPIALFRLDGTLTNVNRANEQLLALPREQLIDQLNVLHDEKATDMWHAAAFRQAAAGTVVQLPPAVYDISSTGQSESHYWLQTSYFPLYDEAGTLCRVGAITLDVSHYKAVEDALQRERELFVGGPVTVFKWVAAAGWPVEYVSPNVAQFGYHPEAFMSGQIAYPDIIYPEDLQRVADEVSAYTDAGVASFEQEYRIVMSGGEVRWIYDYTTIVRNRHGTPTYYDGYILDITEQKTAQEERAAMQQHIIDAQRTALSELSMPLIPLSDHVVIMPLIGTIDTTRGGQIMQTLLAGVAAQRSTVAILDITGVKVLDTHVASAIVQAAQAVKLLGAQVVMTGVSPAMAQTLVHLGVDLSTIVPRSTLQAGIAYAMQRQA